MKPATRYLLIAFWCILAIDCILVYMQLQDERIFTKPVLIPLLFIAFTVQTTGSIHSRSKFLIGAALFFSFVGDVLLLMNDGEDNLYFILGLAAFLAAHVFYIIFFFHIHSINKRNMWVIPIAAVIILIYIGYFLGYMWQSLIIAKLLAPVIVYAVAIGLMLFSAIKTITGRRIKRLAISFFIPGAVLFVTSDSLLGLHKFKNIIADADVLIMLTYGAAQFLLVTGAMKLLKTKDHKEQH